MESHNIGLLHRAARRSRTWLRYTRNRVWHKLSGGRGVPFRVAPGWWVKVHPRAYDDLMYWCRYEQATLNVLTRIWHDSWCILDVGAHVGSFSVSCLRGGQNNIRMVAVEPSPTAADMLELNLQTHNRHSWQIERVAIGDKAGNVELYQGPQEMFTAAPRNVPDASGLPVTVPMETLDHLCHRLKFRPELIKVDVEGFEAEVLCGANYVLDVIRPTLLL